MLASTAGSVASRSMASQSPASRRAAISSSHAMPSASARFTIFSLAPLLAASHRGGNLRIAPTISAATEVLFAADVPAGAAAQRAEERARRRAAPPKAEAVANVATDADMSRGNGGRRAGEGRKGGRERATRGPNDDGARRRRGARPSVRALGEGTRRTAPRRLR